MIKTRKQIILSTFFLTLATHTISSTFCTDNNVVVAQQFDVELPKQVDSSSRKNRMRKPKNKEKKVQKTESPILNLNINNWLPQKMFKEEKNNISATIKYLEQLLKLNALILPC